MASLRLLAGVVAFVACAAAAALTSAQLQPSTTKVLGCPGAPWCPVWVNCSYTEAPGMSCYDCNTRVRCTPAGGLLQPCGLPWLKHCVNGQCRPTPSAACSTDAATEAPTEAPTESPTKAPEEASAEAPAEDPDDSAPEDASGPAEA